MKKSVRFEGKVKPSKCFLFLLFILYGFAVFAVLFSQISVLLKVGISVLLILKGYRSGVLEALQGDSCSIVQFYYMNERWSLLDCKGATYSVELLGESFVSSYIIILHFRERRSKRRKRVILFRDSLSQEEFKKIIVLLLTCKEVAV